MEPEVNQRPAGSGPMMGIIIIVCVMLVGAFFFVSSRLQAEHIEPELPFIVGDPA